MGANQSQESANRFVLPPAAAAFDKYSSNPVYERGSNLTLRWLTNFKIFSLQFRQDLVNGSGSVYALEDALTTANKTYKWTVDSKVFNLSLLAVYHVRLVNEADGNQVIDSHFFNISVPKSKPNIITPSATFTMTSTSSASYSSPTMLQNTTMPAEGLSTGSAIGVGLGCATFLALIALLFVCIDRRRKSRKSPVIGIGPDDYDDDGNYVGPLAASSPTGPEHCRNNTELFVGILSRPGGTYSINRKPLAGTGPSSPITHGIERKPLAGTVPGSYDDRRNYSRTFADSNPTATSHMGDTSIIPRLMTSHAVQGKCTYVPSPSKRVGFSGRLETGRYQIPSPSTEIDFREDIERGLTKISGHLSDTGFSENLERRLSEISRHSSLRGSVHGSVYDVSPASYE